MLYLGSMHGPAYYAYQGADVKQIVAATVILVNKYKQTTIAVG